MLEAVIEKKNVDGLAGFQEVTLLKAIFPDTEGDAILQARAHELDFVAGAAGTVIAAA